MVVSEGLTLFVFFALALACLLGPSIWPHLVRWRSVDSKGESDVDDELERIYSDINKEQICPEWDKMLNQLMDKYPAQDFDGSSVRFGDQLVWMYISWKSYGKAWGGVLVDDRLPRPETMLRLKSVVKDAHDKKRQEELSRAKRILDLPEEPEAKSNG